MHPLISGQAANTRPHLPSNKSIAIARSSPSKSTPPPAYVASYACRLACARKGARSASEWIVWSCSCGRGGAGEGGGAGDRGEGYEAEMLEPGAGAGAVAGEEGEERRVRCDMRRRRRGGAEALKGRGEGKEEMAVEEDEWKGRAGSCVGKTLAGTKPMAGDHEPLDLTASQEGRGRMRWRRAHGREGGDDAVLLEEIGQPVDDGLGRPPVRPVHRIHRVRHEHPIMSEPERVSVLVRSQ